MDNLNLPPFYVGQRVVAVVTPKNKVYKKGDEKTVLGMMQHCNIWYVNIGLSVKVYNEHSTGTKCDACCQKMNNDLIWYCDPRHFVPIEEKFESITLEKILEQETKFVSAN